MSYNGWTNYETWLTNLYLGDYLDSFTRYTGADVETLIYAIVDEDSSNLTGFISEVVSSFLSDVNWDEIAESHNYDVEDEDEDEDDWSENDDYYVPEPPVQAQTTQFSREFIAALNSSEKLLKDLKQSLQDASNGKTYPISELWKD